MDATLDSEDISLLNQLSDKQKDQALTLYTAREKKKSTAYILWILFGVYYFYLGHPFKNILLWLLCFCVIGEIWWIVDLFRLSGMVKRKKQGNPAGVHQRSHAALPRPAIYGYL